MAKTKIVGDLSEQGINSIIKQIEQYKNELLTKTNLFVEKLSDVGITTANATTEFKQYVAFTKSVSPSQYGCTAIMLGISTDLVDVSWLLADGSIKTVQIDPILMTEFGSGQYAMDNSDGMFIGIPSVGQGTFPGQIHAFDSGGWSWKDLDGEWHSSKGLHPKMPMHLAYNEMFSQIKTIWNEVF